jgi:hypothetical protein
MKPSVLWVEKGGWYGNEAARLATLREARRWSAESRRVVEVRERGRAVVLATIDHRQGLAGVSKIVTSSPYGRFGNGGDDRPRF